MARKRAIQGLTRPSLNAGPTAIDKESMPAPIDIGADGSENSQQAEGARDPAVEFGTNGTALNRDLTGDNAAPLVAQRVLAEMAAADAIGTSIEPSGILVRTITPRKNPTRRRHLQAIPLA
jgi:hypothetical protein